MVPSPTTHPRPEDALDRDVNEDIDRLLDAIERIADGLAGIADAINRMNDAHARGARPTTEGA